MSEAIETIARLAQHLNARNDAELAKLLDVNPSSIASWRARDTVPYKACVFIAKRDGISLDWLLTGTEQRQPAFTDTARLFLDQLQSELQTLSRRVERLEDKIEK